ncbi:bifunctional alpha,alpha-trehalose-phosphate synthase (UDP-forming)/trehalose-phosphatase [candidate division KSB1 bacterium]|nr:bifunctional alpha,alpha-trehalose-phosphate synthase (UDP-forming)/trehalose-phosphatase [candidate division KSB1 bacterium]
MSKRLVIISNRLPLSINKRKGKLSYQPSSGGLATGMSSFYQKYDSLWIGWPGYAPESKTEQQDITQELADKKMSPVFLSRRQVELYYEGFSNKTIWPLFHYFSQYTLYDSKSWLAYKRVNQIFCDKVLEHIQPNDILWVHDYHLLLLPGMIREKTRDALIGFFLHIPFPSYELFRTLPWRQEIMNGILGADLIGFHTYDYVRHFLSSTSRIVGLEHSLARLRHDDRVIKVDSFPMGIDYDKYHETPKQDKVQKEIKKFKTRLKTEKIILSIDRLDYSKGIPQRLEGYHQFLHDHPEYREKITLIMLVVPSRARVESYRKLKYQLDELVGRINGEHGTIGWTPIYYLYRSVPFHVLSALYNMSDVGLVTPFRDGMNLVSKEFVASKRSDKGGVLILSEMAGSSHELGEAIMINPNNIAEIAHAIKTALEIPLEEQKHTLEEMNLKLKRYSVKRWAEDFMERLLQTHGLSENLASKKITTRLRQFISRKFNESKKRVLILDYDGTLVGYARTPEKAKPTAQVRSVLKHLSQLPNCMVIINSGRKRETLQDWFGDLEVNFIAEHGAWLKRYQAEWFTIESLNTAWKSEIMPILEHYVMRTPGSFIEEKNYSLVWHYRKANVGLGALRATELMDSLKYMTANLNLQVMEGNKVIEVKNAGVNKGRAALRYLEEISADFILAMGDDWTDEYMFRDMPNSAYTIKVGYHATSATYSMRSPQEALAFLEDLSKSALRDSDQS